MGAPQSLLEPLSPAEIDAAERRIAGHAIRAPLVRTRDGVGLKLECLQPFGSYKIRGATNVILARRERGEVANLVVSASAGNFGQSLTAAGRRLGLQVSIHTPDNAARVKVEALRRLGAQVTEHSFDDWWRIMQSRDAGEPGGAFIHPVAEREVMAGAATIGRELMADRPDLETVLVPLGGGGLAVGIAQGVKAINPDCRIVVIESEAAMPFTAARAAGQPVTVERTPCFIDGMGSGRLLDEMWPLLQRWIDDVIVVPVEAVRHAVRRLALEHHVVAEGAGAAALAAAETLPEARQPTAAAIVSGGNIDHAVLKQLL